MSLDGSVAGASGSSSIAWSHIGCLGGLLDFSSLNTFLCLAYSAGRVGEGVSCFTVGTAFLSCTWDCGCTTTLPMKYCGGILVRGTFLVRGTNLAFAASEAFRMRGSWV